MRTELSEALKASKKREAMGLSRSGRDSVLAAYATDGFVTIFYNNHDQPAVERSWSSLLPDERKFIFALDWEPVEPKDPLTQLAETLKDWREDGEENG